VTPSGYYKQLIDVTNGLQTRNRVHPHFIRILNEVIEECALVVEKGGNAEDVRKLKGKAQNAPHVDLPSEYKQGG
jgi:hypothetical protein